MPYAMHPYIQLIPDWMTGGVLAVAAWGIPGAGVLLAMVADTPTSLIAPLIGSIFGLGIAVVQWLAARERTRSRVAELEAKSIAQEAEIVVLKSHIAMYSDSSLNFARSQAVAPHATHNTPPRAAVGGAATGSAGRSNPDR